MRTLILALVIVSIGTASAQVKLRSKRTKAAPTPTFSPAAGTYPATQAVAINESVAGAAIYYTSNGTTPTTASTRYSGALTIGADTTVKAIATAINYTQSNIAIGQFQIAAVAATPTISLPPGTYSGTQTVTIADATPGAAIYYTTNGTVPTTASTLYTGAISVSSTETVRAMATALGYTPSAVISAAYTITGTAATPTFSVPPGTYTVSQAVALACSTPGCAVHYTTDGSAPTSGSPTYLSPVAVNTTTTIKAVTVAGGYTTSGVSSGTYTINAPTPPITALFATTFASTSAMQAPVQCGSIECYQVITGTDGGTGSAWPPSIMGSNDTGQFLQGTSFQLQPYGPYTTGTIGAVISNAIVSGAGHNGTTVPMLSQTLNCFSTGHAYSGVACVDSSTPGAHVWGQDPFVVSPNITRPQTDLYIRAYIKLPSTLATTLIPGTWPDGQWGNWLAFSEWKTGGPLEGDPGSACVTGQSNVYGGDLRIINDIYMGSGGVLFWHTQMDSNANSDPKVVPLVTFWTIENKTVPVPIGTWFKYEWFWHRSAGADGRVWMAVNGQVIYDRSGWNINTPTNNTSGTGHSCPINRITFPTVYTNGGPPAPVILTDDLEYWPSPPSDATLH